MKSKGITMRTLFLLVMGAIVAGLILYWAYTVFLKTGTESSKQFCMAKVKNYCQQWYSRDPALDDGDRDLNAPEWETFAPDCPGYEPMNSLQCRQELGLPVLE